MRGRRYAAFVNLRDAVRRGARGAAAAARASRGDDAARADPDDAEHRADGNAENAPAAVVTTPFPPRFAKARLGMKLSAQELDARAKGLDAWLGAVVSARDGALIGGSTTAREALFRFVLLDEHARAATPAPASAAAAASSRALVHPELDFDADVDEDAADPIFDDGGGAARRGGGSRVRDVQVDDGRVRAGARRDEPQVRRGRAPAAAGARHIVFLAERNRELESAMAFGAAPLVRL